MADAWLEISSAHYDSHCGDSLGATLQEALDGDDIWAHTQGEVHWFILDLGATYTIKKVRGRSESNSDPIDVDVYVSDDKEDWGAAVATGISTWQDTGEWQEVDSTDKNGRYIKVVVNATEEGSPGGIEFGDWTPFTIFDAYGDVAAAPPAIGSKTAHMAAKMIAGKLI